MGQAASTDAGAAKPLPTANDVRALLFGGTDKAKQRQRTLTTPSTAALTTPSGSVQKSELVFEGSVQQLQSELPLTYTVGQELSQRPPNLIKRRTALAMDDDAADLLVVSATCSLGDATLTVLADEPMCACVDIFDGEVRVHFVSPTNPALGGIVLIATRDAEGVISLRGGDDYWWDGYPPIIHARERGATKAVAKPVFAGSFFEKDVAVRGLQGEANLVD